MAPEQKEWEILPINVQVFFQHYIPLLQDTTPDSFIFSPESNISTSWITVLPDAEIWFDRMDITRALDMPLPLVILRQWQLWG